MAEEGVVEQKIYAERLAKAEALKAKGINPFGNGFAPTHTAGELSRRFEVSSSPLLGAFSNPGESAAISSPGASVGTANRTCSPDSS